MKTQFKTHKPKSMKFNGKGSNGLSLAVYQKPAEARKDFAMWLHGNTKNGRFLDIYECGDKISQLLGGVRIYQNDVYNFITHSKRILESRYGCSVMFVSGWGYRVAFDEDLAMVAGKRVKKWYGLTDDCVRILKIVDRKHTKVTLKTIYGLMHRDVRFAGKEAKNRFKALNRAILGYNKQTREELKEIVQATNGVKLIESK